LPTVEWRRVPQRRIDVSWIDLILVEYRMQSRKIVAIGACVLFLRLSLLAQVPAEASLPDLASFWERVRGNLGSQYDEGELLKGYTYRRTSVIEELASDGSIRNRETREYDVYHLDSGRFQRLISKNKIPLTQKESKDEDERFRKFLTRKPRERSAREQQDVFNDILNAYDFKILKREIRNARPTLVIAFKPKKDAKLKTMVARRIFPKSEGTAWVDEEDAQVARIDVYFIDDVKLGFGLLASIGKDTRMTREWQKLRNEIWVPSHNESRVKARVLLAKGYNRRRTDDYVDYKKFSVETTLRFMGLNP
jgi:hypothetical protein